MSRETVLMLVLAGLGGSVAIGLACADLRDGTGAPCTPATCPPDYMACREGACVPVRLEGRPGTVRDLADGGAR